VKFVKFNKKTCYALKIMVDLASQPDGALVLSKDIAKRRKIPPRFMAQIIASLVKGGLISSFRGSRGGIRISCDPAKISITHVVEKIQSFSEPSNPCVAVIGECKTRTGCLMQIDKCPIRNAWMEAQRKMMDVLKDTSLEDLVNLERNSLATR